MNDESFTTHIEGNNMVGMSVGDFIRSRRKALRLTQEKLCDGICEPVTISRIEKGANMPSLKVLRALMERLGTPNTYYTLPKGADECRLDDLAQEVNLFVNDFQDAATADKPACRKKALEALDELEGLTTDQDRQTRQLILKNRALLGTEDGPYPPKERRELILQALRLTSPHFDSSDINSLRYTMEETLLINQIAVTYNQEGDRETAISVYRQLLQYLQQNSSQLPRYPAQVIMVTFNYALALVHEERYEEAVTAIEIGRQACIKFGKHEMHPQFLALLANCHAHLGHREESEIFYHMAYYVYLAFENLDGIEHLKNDAIDTLGLSLP